MILSNFKTKTKAINYIKYNLNYNYKTGDQIKDSPFFDLLRSIVNNHYNFAELIGSGIDYFFITNCDIYPKNRKFNIKRTDGTCVDFSYRKAISGKKPTNEKYIKRALRLVIKPFTDSFKKDYFKENSDSKGYIKCPMTGLKTNIKTCHVDHEYPYTFDSLYYKFFMESKIDVNTIPFKKTGGDNRPVILDDAMNKKFYEWHKRNAKLRCVYWKANLQDKRTKDFNGIAFHCN